MWHINSNGIWLHIYRRIHHQRKQLSVHFARILKAWLFYPRNNINWQTWCYLFDRCFIVSVSVVDASVVAFCHCMLLLSILKFLVQRIRKEMATQNSSKWFKCEQVSPYCVSRLNSCFQTDMPCLDRSHALVLAIAVDRTVIKHRKKITQVTQNLISRKFYTEYSMFDICSEIPVYFPPK